MPKKTDRPTMGVLRTMAGGTDADVYEVAARTGFLPAMAAELIEARRELKAKKSSLRRLWEATMQHIQTVERLMQKPPNEARGRALADACNRLELEGDLAARFGLGQDFGGKPLKRIRANGEGK